MQTLVVVVRGLHVGFLGCYGNEWIATPNLDRLAAEGIVFDLHYLTQPGEPLTFPSDGRLAVERREAASVANFAAAVLESAPQTDTELLLIEGPELAPPWDLPEELRDVYFDEDEEQAEPWLDPPCDAVGTLSVDEFLELHNTYAAAVTWFDAQLGAVFDHLRSTGHLDRLTVVVTARSGLPLGEHGVIGLARPWLHEELVHVPLIVRLPAGRDAGTRVSALTQPDDVVATLLALSGRGEELSTGYNLLPLTDGSAAEVRPYACAHLEIAGRAEWSLRTPDWALLLPVRIDPEDAREPLLYAKPEDRWEANDIRQHRIDLADALEQTLRAYMEQNRAAGKVVYPPLPGF